MIDLLDDGGRKIDAAPSRFPFQLRPVMFFLLQSSFEAFGPAHNLAILATFALTAAFTWHARRTSNGRSLVLIRRVLAALLILAVFLDPVLVLIRYGWNATGWELVAHGALPFHLCDIVSIFLALALVNGNQRLAEIGFLWGISATLQALFMPTLTLGPSEVEFYVFFLQHGGAPMAAVLLVWGLGITPQPGALRRAICWSIGYIVVVMALNALLGQNYGFLNAKPPIASLFDLLGPWPYYLIGLQAVAYTLYALLLKIAPTTTPGSVPGDAAVSDRK
jgi:hypothetical integral membrane protein (TIGR02206 family)